MGNQIIVGSTTFNFTELQEKYIKMLIFQACLTELKDKTFDEISDKIFTLLEARKIYVDMYKYEYYEEPVLLKELTMIFTFIKNAK